MLLTAFFPFATYALPGIAGFFLTILVIELDIKWALLGYIASSLLAILVVPDKEAVFVYVFFLGLYPILKSKFESMKSTVISYLLKIAFFNITIITCYTILFYLLQISAIIEEFGAFSTYMFIMLLLAANVTFIVYDIALTQVIKMYIHRVRNKIMKD